MTARTSMSTGDPFAIPSRLGLANTDATWCRDRVAALRRRLRSASAPYTLAVDASDRVAFTLLDTFDWRVLRRGLVAVAVTGWESEDAARADEEALFISAPRRRDPPFATEATVPAPRNTLTLRPKTIHSEQLDSIKGNRTLLAVGTATATRRRYTLRNAREKIVAVVDEITIANQLTVLRIRPLRGFAGTLTSIATGPRVGVTAIVTAIARCGGREPFDYATKLNLSLAPDDTVATAHDRIVPVLCRTMALNVPGIEGQIDPEFLHDYRVALRRLRSYTRELGVPLRFEGENAEAAGVVDAVWDASGVARDYDVFLERERDYLDAAPATLREEIATVFRRIESLRDESYARFLSVRPPEFEAVLEAHLQAAAATVAAGRSASEAAGAVSAIPSPRSAAETAQRWVRRREKRFLRAAAALSAAYRHDHEALDDEEIHVARKAAKKYRYLQEIFLPILPAAGRIERRVKRLRKLQNLLGSYNDLVVEEHRFHELLTHSGSVSFSDVRGALAYMLARVEAEKHRARGRVLKELEKESL